MKRSLLFSIAIGSMMGLLSLGPVQTIAANDNTSFSVVAMKKDKEEEYKEKIEKAKENWNALSREQKDEVYKLVNNRIKEDNKILDKLVEFGVMEKADAEFLKNSRLERFGKMKEKGDFPLYRHKSNKDK